MVSPLPRLLLAGVSLGWFQKDMFLLRLTYMEGDKKLKKFTWLRYCEDKGHFFYDALQLVFTRSCLIFREKKKKYLFLWCLLGKNKRYHFNRQLKTSMAYVRKQWRSSLLQCSVHQLTGVLSDLF